MTRIFYFLVFAQAVCGIFVRFFVKRFLEKNPLVKDKPLVKKHQKYVDYQYNALSCAQIC